MNNLEEVLVFVDSVDVNYGDKLCSLISRFTNENGEHPLLNDGVMVLKYKHLILEDEEDFFLLKKEDKWQLVTGRGRILSIGMDEYYSNAIYVQHNGNYAFVVGEGFDLEPLLNQKEVPPL